MYYTYTSTPYPNHPSPHAELTKTKTQEKLTKHNAHNTYQLKMLKKILIKERNHQLERTS